jgi:hypothetical protein
MWDELENSLAWFKAAPGKWIESGKKNLEAAAQWIWEVIQGDFNDDQTTAQMATGMVISMIPFVDQVCDVRDVVANCKKINQDTSNKWAWIGLVLTLIGLFPTLGSLVKGCFKILFAAGRKFAFKAGKEAVQSDFWKLSKPFVESGIVKLNEFLARPEVRNTLKAMKLDNPYKYLAKEVRELAGQINVGALTKEFDKMIGHLKSFTDLIEKWGSAAMKTQAGELLKKVKVIRDQANTKLAEVLKPVQNWLDKLARRLEVEADMNYRATTNALNPHAFKKPSLDDEIALAKTNKPVWMDVKAKPANPALKVSPNIPKDFPDISATSKKATLKGKFDTFHTADPITYAPGTTLYRVVDPASADNSICWMTLDELKKLNSRDDWRRYFAVWGNWNKNGEYVTYTVPPGKPLNAWEGVVGTQILQDKAGSVVNAGGGKSFMLEGGARQIVLDPDDLDKAFIGKRKSTNWGYSSLGESTSLVGVPTLTNNWYTPKK